MALVDGVLFDTKSLVNRTLDYKRRKTGKRAIVVLPARVVALLTKLPQGQPFRRPDFKLESDKAFWRIQLQDLFERARITEVKPTWECVHRTRINFVIRAPCGTSARAR